MEARLVPTDGVDRALTEAVFDDLDDGTFVGLVPAAFGIVAFGATLRACEDEGRSVLGEWILLGFERGHDLPALGGIELNKEPLVESVDPLYTPRFRPCPARA